MFKPTWARVLAGILGGAVLAELAHVATGGSKEFTEGMSSLLMIVFAIAIFALLTILVKDKKL